MWRVLPKVTSGLAVVWSLAWTGSAQEQNALPAFPSRVEVVTVDVVVVDKQGRAVRGLAAADFTVFEDGRPSERAFVFLVDDLGLDFGPVSGAKKAIAQWLNTKAVPADDVTILTTSGDLSWNDRVATGREDPLGIQLTGGGGGSRFLGRH